MSINSIHQGPVVSPFSPVGTTSLREISSQEKIQLLRTTILSEKLDSELASSKALMEDASKLLNGVPPKSNDFPNFWADMHDTFEERQGLDAIEHEYSRDLSHLRSKGSQMMLYLERSPNSPTRDSEIQKLTKFMQTEQTRITERRTMNLFIHLQHQGQNSNSVDLSAFSKGVTDQTHKLRALTATLQNSTPSS